jgi:hypothetical protein
VRSAHAEDRRVEVAVANALIPRLGYDDNDSIEAVLTGELPNPCFKLADSAVERVGSQFVLRQFAWQRTDGVCGTGDLIDDPVPFVTETTLGRLTQGTYALAFDPDTRPVPALRSFATRSFATHAMGMHTKTFVVDAAPVGQIDTFNYAAITGATTSQVNRAGQHVTLTLSGTLATRCARVRTPIEVKRIDDVFVVLPIIEPVHSQDCSVDRQGFEVKVDLGATEAGQYLAHVRSRNGRAVQRVFEVDAARP